MSRSTVAIDTRDGRCEASLFTPDVGVGPWPAVLFFMDGIGIRPALFAMAERIAANGHVVLLPDLFYRAGPYPAQDPAKLFSDPEFRQSWFAKFVSTATQENVKNDTGAFLDFLSARGDVKQPKIGVVGYCMGGGLALAAAGNFPDRVAAAASYHGGRLATDAPESPHLLAPKMKAAIYVAGATDDASFPDDMKSRLVEALTRAGVDHTVETYPARHGWVPSDTPVHDPAQAERHFRTLFDLFHRAL
ncbi:MAG: dienelactone hydrolase family protein [Polyangiales bacterium]